jgi:3-oxoacyl-[acyl-carrier-protein] synthase-3
MKMDLSKVPSVIHKFGNTSSVSIPLTIASELSGEVKNNKMVLLSGFGVGLSWASSILNLNGVHIPEIVEV